MASRRRTRAEAEEAATTALLPNEVYERIASNVPSLATLGRFATASRGMRAESERAVAATIACCYEPFTPDEFHAVFRANVEALIAAHDEGTVDRTVVWYHHADRQPLWRSKLTFFGVDPPDAEDEEGEEAIRFSYTLARTEYDYFGTLMHGGSARWVVVYDGPYMSSVYDEDDAVVVNVERALVVLDDVLRTAINTVGAPISRDFAPTSDGAHVAPFPQQAAGERRDNMRYVAGVTRSVTAKVFEATKYTVLPSMSLFGELLEARRAPQCSGNVARHVMDRCYAEYGSFLGKLLLDWFVENSIAKDIRAALTASALGGRKR